VSLEHIRQLLLGHEIEPDAKSRDIRLFFAVSWGLVSSPSIRPLIPDELDGQLSQVSCSPDPLVCSDKTDPRPQATSDYFAEQEPSTGDAWKLPRVMMWLQKKHSKRRAPRDERCRL
jgi:hypothetical protein